MPDSGERELWVIVNPRTGNRRGFVELAKALRALETRGWRAHRFRTTGPREATHIAARAAAAGAEAVLVCGGDGTINEAVNGLAGSDTALAVLPSGTVNIWARETKLSRDPGDAVRLVETGVRRQVDLGLIGERRFLLFASVGADSEAVRVVSAAAKQRWGRWAYIAQGVRAFARSGGDQLTIESPAGTEHGNFVAVVAGNTRLYGGLFRATAAARLDDGMLDLCAYRGSGWVTLGLHLARTLLGRHQQSRRTLYLRESWFRIRSREPKAVQADGEDFGLTPVELRIEPAALTVIVPARLKSGLFTGGQNSKAGD